MALMVQISEPLGRRRSKASRTAPRTMPGPAGPPTACSARPSLTSSNQRPAAQSPPGTPTPSCLPLGDHSKLTPGFRGGPGPGTQRGTTLGIGDNDPAFGTIGARAPSALIAAKPVYAARKRSTARTRPWRPAGIHTAWSRMASRRTAIGRPADQAGQVPEVSFRARPPAGRISRISAAVPRRPRRRSRRPAGHQGRVLSRRSPRGQPPPGSNRRSRSTGILEYQASAVRGPTALAAGRQPAAPKPLDCGDRRGPRRAALQGGGGSAARLGGRGGRQLRGLLTLHSRTRRSSPPEASSRPSSEKARRSISGNVRRRSRIRSPWRRPSC